MNLFDAPTPGETAAVDAALRTRRSMRAFLPTPVPRGTVEAILEVAARAPSGTNTQPWFVHALTGAAKRRLSDRILALLADPEALAAHQEEYPYYPEKWIDPYLERRRKVGWDLYALLGIGKADKARMAEQHARNFRFFDAPVGLVFTVDRVMQQGSFLDYGMFLQGVMVAARARGLHTCPQAAFTRFHRAIEEELVLPPERMVVCGMSLGFADPAAPENGLETERAPVSTFATFLDA